MEQKRCYGCMRLKDDQPVCPHCGYDERTQNDIHQLPTGTVLKEQYLIGRVLGQGGFGITYLAWDLYLDTPVAVKEYFPKEVVMRECSVSTNVSICTTDGETRFRNNKERFLREAKMLARFSQTPEMSVQPGPSGANTISRLAFAPITPCSFSHRSVRALKSLGILSP